MECYANRGRSPNAWALSFRERDALSIQEDAINSQPDRLVQPFLWFAAARNFAPLACYEAAKYWQTRSEPYAATHAELWRSVCEFLPVIGREQLAEGAAACKVSVEDGKAFYQALCMEQQRRPADAQAIFQMIASRHPLAAARLSRTAGMAVWDAYRGPVNTAVIAFQCHAIARRHLVFVGLLGGFRRYFQLHDDHAQPGFTALRLATELGLSEAALDFAGMSYCMSERMTSFPYPAVEVAAREDIVCQMVLAMSGDKKCDTLIQSIMTQEVVAYGELTHQHARKFLELQIGSLGMVNDVGRAAVATCQYKLNLALLMKLPSPLLASHIQLSLVDCTANVVLPTQSGRSTPPSLHDIVPDNMASPHPTAISAYENIPLPPAEIAASNPNVSPSQYQNVDSAAIYANNCDALHTNTTHEAYGVTAEEELEPSFVSPSTANTISSESLSRIHALWQKCCVPEIDPRQEAAQLYRGTFLRGIGVQLSPTQQMCTLCGYKSFSLSVPWISYALSSHLADQQLAASRALNLLLVPYAQLNAPNNDLVSCTSFYTFAAFLTALGPDVALNALQLCSLPYFHGRIPKEVAEGLVRARGGSFLLRWSSTMAGVYFIVVSDRDARSVRHIKIEGEGDGRGKVWLMVPTVVDDTEARKERQVFGSIGEAVNSVRRVFRMKHPVGNSRYWIAMTSVRPAQAP